MAKIVETDAIPNGSEARTVITKNVELKNVLFDGGQEDLTIEVVPFNRYNEQHTEFAFAYSDMLYRAPSEFRNISDASKAYIRTAQQVGRRRRGL